MNSRKMKDARQGARSSLSDSEWYQLDKMNMYQNHYLSQNKTRLYENK